MKRVRHTPEPIIRKLREPDADLANGMAIPEVCKELGVAEITCYRWRDQFGGMKADEMKRLKDLEKENARLKALGKYGSCENRRGGNHPVLHRLQRRRAALRALLLRRVGEQIQQGERHASPPWRKREKRD